MDELFEKGIALDFANMVEYSAGGIISKQVLKNEAGNITLFSFDEGQGLSAHTAPFDALVQVLEGKAEITIGDLTIVLNAGQSVIMPAGISHALYAPERFKMLLTMIKG